MEGVARVIWHVIMQYLVLVLFSTLYVILKTTASCWLEPFGLVTPSILWGRPLCRDSNQDALLFIYFLILEFPVSSVLSGLVGRALMAVGSDGVEFFFFSTALLSCFETITSSFLLLFTGTLLGVELYGHVVRPPFSSQGESWRMWLVRGNHSECVCSWEKRGELESLCFGQPEAKG